mgnify:CR=1 FL=1
MWERYKTAFIAIAVVAVLLVVCCYPIILLIPGQCLQPWVIVGVALLFYSFQCAVSLIVNLQDPFTARSDAFDAPPRPCFAASTPSAAARRLSARRVPELSQASCAVFASCLFVKRLFGERRKSGKLERSSSRAEEERDSGCRSVLVWIPTPIGVTHRI